MSADAFAYAVPLSLEQMVADGMVEYIDFPDALKGKYQSYTCADISLLREAGYDDAAIEALLAKGAVAENEA